MQESLMKLHDYEPESDEMKLFYHLQSAFVHYDEDKPPRIRFMIHKFVKRHPNHELTPILDSIIQLLK